MSNQTLPDDQRLILFTDLTQTEREGFYSDDLGLFVEATGNSAHDRTGKTFGPGEVTSWKYIEDNSRNSDFMVIF
ncbi:hypothetical protein [Dyadobacter sandarakinus]|uniref:Uncharacterized protein n=1 Tax=Dyadobacter sandarakinus TaxID=2747268 RepID=A0ABX7I7T9_9BACT|nr:hypothetical protein [Dyadobacter sandarakinus]QRR02000.1 hypothetical protein HWI92_14325 [Dyadobacter sandarakinus]